MAIFLNERNSGAAHITAANEAAAKAAIIGNGNYVFDTGSKLAVSISPAVGAVSVSDGVFSFCGRIGGIVTAETATYTPPASDTMFIKCVVCIKYNKNTNTAIETPSVVVFSSEPQLSETAAQALTVDTGASEITSATQAAFFPLWEFIANGSSATEPVQKFETVSSLTELAEALEVEKAERENAESEESSARSTADTALGERIGKLETYIVGNHNSTDISSVGLPSGYINSRLLLVVIAVGARKTTHIVPRESGYYNLTCSYIASNTIKNALCLFTVNGGTSISFAVSKNDTGAAVKLEKVICIG